jgi:hypothetical protein
MLVRSRYATPSLLEGVDAALEQELRTYACEVIFQTGSLLRLSAVTISTAQTLLQRFFFVKSLRKYDVRDMLLGATYLATKLEESHVDPRSIVNSVHHVYQVREGRPVVPISIYDPAYSAMKDTIFAAERKMLKSLGFHVFVEHPHRFILAFLKILGCHDNRELVQKCWNFLNDSMRTTLCVQYPAHVVAATAIYLAARTLQRALPVQWWTLFDTTLEQLEDAGMQVLLLYEKRPATYHELTPRKVV